MIRRRTYTHPDVLTTGVTQGWAERETNPARIDWPARQVMAAIPFEVRRGRPVNPCERTRVRRGRNELGRWGENLMADALVTATEAGHRFLLMVERGDGYGWAVPGGSVEPGETGAQAAVRELAEETGLHVDPDACRAGRPQYVPDPRASREAWAVTIPVHVDLGGGPTDTLPVVTGADDARRAEWVPASTYDVLAGTLIARHDATVFAAHQDLLRQFLAGGTLPEVVCPVCAGLETLQANGVIAQHHRRNVGMLGNWEQVLCEGSGRMLFPASDPAPADSPVEIISFGYGHGAPPQAHVTIDVRGHFRDPYVDLALRGLTAQDAPVMAAVLGTPGIPVLIRSIVDMAHAYWCAPWQGPLTIAVGCVGGRHRSAAVAREVARLLAGDGTQVTLTHRDLDRPVIDRPAERGQS